MFVIIGMSWCCAYVPYARAQANFYGGYGDERKADKTPSPTILFSKVRQQNKPLTDYMACPPLEAECMVCTRGKCDELPPPACEPHVAILGSFAGTTYLFLHFFSDRRAMQDRNALEPYQICTGDESAYIFAQKGSPADAVVPLLWIQPERNNIRVTLEAAAGQPVLRILRCAFGTGGCVEELYLLAGEQWMPLMRDASWNAVYNNLPPGYYPHKSPMIDFETMHWDRAIAMEKDNNCCPSGRISIDLSIKNHRLHVKKYHYETGIKY